MEPSSLTYWEDAASSPASVPLQKLQTQHINNHQHPLKTDSGLGHGGGRPDDQSIYHFCDGNLNFSTAHSEDDEYFHKKKLSRDPMSHRIIEKRRRDRMNNCLADLSRLIPAEYLKKGRGRIEKTEIIEMAIQHMQYLQNRANQVIAEQQISAEARELRMGKYEQSQSPDSDREPTPASASNSDPLSPPPPTDVVRPIDMQHYRLGYQECLSEAMHFLVEVEGFLAGDALCVQLINHLQKHCDKIVKGDRLNFPRTRQAGEGSSSSGSSSSCGMSKVTAPTAAWSSSEEQAPTVPMSNSDSLTNGYSHTPHPDNHQNYSHVEQQHHSYKFKNNIKQRFEEHSGQKRRRSRSPSPTYSNSPFSPSHQPQAQIKSGIPVPIFVLHSKRSFYIPLTVSYEVLAPYLDSIDFSSDESTNPSTASSLSQNSIVLHPITISVNFQPSPKSVSSSTGSGPPLSPVWPRTPWGICGGPDHP